MQKILIVDDCLSLNESVRKVLARDYLVKSAATLTEAKSIVDGERFDLVVLDLELPDGSGFQFCSYLKDNDSTRETPIMIISGNTDHDAKVTGLDLGADDFLGKPFNKREFCARVRARLRATRSFHLKNNIKGPFLVDVKMQKIFLNEEGQPRDLDLTRFEYRLLCYLLERDNQVFTREQLISLCFGSDYNVSDRSIDLHIYWIRKKIGDTHDVIETVYGTGYMLKIVS